MATLGAVAVFAAIFCLLATTVTGRKQWLAIWIWCLPILGMAYIAPQSIDINGLLIVICAIMIFEIIYCLCGVRLWCKQTDKRHMPLSCIVAVLNFLLSLYCFQQSFISDYFGITTANGKMTAIILSVVCSVIASAVMQDISLTVIDRYFSKKESFAIIKCSTVTKSCHGKKEKYKKYTMQGVINGRDFVLHMTQKTFLLLKQEKSFMFNVRKGALGGVYVMEDVYMNISKRRIKRVNKFLFKRAVFVLLTAVLVILLFVRIKTGAGFEEIFLGIGRGAKI